MRPPFHLSGKKSQNSDISATSRCQDERVKAKEEQHKSGSGVRKNLPYELTRDQSGMFSDAGPLLKPGQMQQIVTPEWGGGRAG